MTMAEYNRMRERDLVGRKARVLTKIENRGGHAIHEGALVTIVAKFGGLHIRTEMCTACHVSTGIKKVHPHDLELLPLMPIEET